MIDYNNYPLLLHTSFTREDVPTELHFEVVSVEVREYLSKCNGYSELFGIIGAKNTLKREDSNTHFYLEDKLFHKIDSDDHFRRQQFSNFFSDYIKPKNGTILFKDGGQYLYLLLGVQETGKLKKRNGRYIAVALFQGDLFIGFEEGYITERGVQVEHTGHYENEMPVGGYISFVLVTLAFAGDKQHELFENATTEIIYKL